MGLRKTTLVIVAGLVSAIGGGPTAAADVEQHCVAQAFPSGAPSTEPTAVCFPTFAQAAAFATGGALVLPANTPSRLLTPAEIQASEAGQTGMTLLGIDYEHINFGGASLWWYGSGGCDSATEFYVDWYPFDWRNRVSSSVAYNNCNHWYHYSDAGRNGVRIDCAYCTQFGAMNDATWSAYWSYNAIP
jgi:hypothetical protein